MPKVEDIAHLRYQVPDLDRTERFMTAFGLVTAHRDADDLYMRGSEEGAFVYHASRGAEARFLGPSFRVASPRVLAEATRVAGAGPVEAIGGPFGGSRVGLAGPEGYEIELVHGVKVLPALPAPAPLVYNNASIPARPNTTCRVKKGPTPISRISHCALYCIDPGPAIDWFVENLGLLISDEVSTPDGVRGAAFMRCDKGATPTDHHTLAAIKAGVTKIHHSSFWVEDFDALHVGALWMEGQGHVHEHGIGRHTLGSQVFSYWRDPDGFLHERFTDGDILDNSVPTGRHPLSMEMFFQWGPEPPASFHD